VKPGDKYQITRVERPDPDHYAVIHYGRGWAFGCSKAWFDAERPSVGAYVVMGADNHWHVEGPEEEQSNGRRKD